MRFPPHIFRPSRLLATALLLCAEIAGGGELLSPGDPAPGFSFTDIQSGETRDLDEVAGGGPLLVVFLQTACGTCIREMVGLKKVVAEVSDCRVLGVFVDIRARGLEEYVALYDLPFTFTWDQDSSKAEAYGVSCCPTSFLLGPDGRVSAVYSGFDLSTVASIRSALGRLAVQR